MTHICWLWAYQTPLGANIRGASFLQKWKRSQKVLLGADAKRLETRFLVATSAATASWPAGLPVGEHLCGSRSLIELSI